MIGATSLDSYLRIIGLLSSAAAALWGLSVFSSFFFTVDSDVDFLSRWVVGVVNILSIFEFSCSNIRRFSEHGLELSI